jgi:type II secretory pathway pseudopilin PulG
MTLMELILAVALLGILTTLMVEFLLPTMHAVNRGEALVEMEQEGTVVLQKLADDLSQTSASGVMLNNNVYSYVRSNGCVNVPAVAPTAPIVLSVQRLDQVCSAYNAQTWDTQAISLYVWNAAGEVTRRFFPGGACDTSGIPTAPADYPGLVTPCQLCALGVNQSLPSERLATGVTWFSVSYPTALARTLCPPTIRTQDGFPPTPLTVTIRLQRRASTGMRTPMTVTLSRTMAMREEGLADVPVPTASPVTISTGVPCPRGTSCPTKPGCGPLGTLTPPLRPPLVPCP